MATKKTTVPFTKAGIKKVPNDKSVVYEMKTGAETEYVGMAKAGRAQERLKEHLPGAKDSIKKVTQVTIQKKSSKAVALADEKKLIKAKQPPQNKRSK
jgi:predicted GIY-YIG superfamily endonuclease